ncbi:MAG: precorrin-3B C(17)-methyltransferase, partial [Propionibacteriaceae bacterium]|nr:precorrin-3B C(17)-methyltransferase [Propionibacteriaceae bacterium]
EPPVLGAPTAGPRRGVGQLTNPPAARAHADAIDAALGATRRYDGKASEHLAAAWSECDLIISHLALGATTRLIAPLLTDKKSDPGVVVVDEAGSFVVPLVGGHVGGANELARRVADAIGATAVVTTATDATGMPGLDTLGWETSGDLAGVTRALLDGEPVELVREQPWPLPALPTNVREPGVVRVERRGTHETPMPDLGTPVARIVVSDAVPAAPADGTPTVTLHPRSLVVGMGCNRGTSLATLEELLEHTLAETGWARASITALTSVDAKADESSLIELAAQLGVPFATYPADALADVSVPNPSGAPQAAVGTPSVAEASVIAHGADLIVEKRKNSDATIAIGRLAPIGTLAVVGLGPGADDLLTPRARDVLRASAVVVGYRPYVAQIRHLLRPGTEVLAIGMGTEEHRIEFAIAKAREGRSVSLVCGGDPAIYAMASPLLEKGTEGVDVQVVPGVTAELAASAILGAPLGHDHVTISLSDLHTDWDTIERRLQAAAEGDFVVALYNPRSKKRVMHLPRALEILGARRPPGTPVAVVQDASRPNQNHRVAALADFDPEWVDMHSIVIVGSSTTRLVPTGHGAQAMVTPRDYHWMDKETS